MTNRLFVVDENFVIGLYVFIIVALLVMLVLVVAGVL